MNNIKIHVCGPRDAPKDGSMVINTTSRSTNWSKGLSPFFLGPVKLYGDYVSKNVENGWQYSKCFSQHADENGNPTADYFLWAQNGWNNSWANRYPMGKGAKPICSYWDGRKLDYISARKEIYIPLYKQGVENTDAFGQLKEIAGKEEIWLWDFDGYNYEALGMTIDEVINCREKKMGHAFALVMMLEGKYDESV